MPVENKRKLMVRDLGNPKDVLKTVGKNTDGSPVYQYPERLVLGTMLGTVSKIKMLVNLSGDEVETLLGDFMGTNEFGQPIVRAQTMSLPQAWSQMITGAFYQENGSEQPVEFAMEVGVSRSADAALGWTWTLNPLIKPAPSNAVTRLHEMVEAYYAAAGTPHNYDDHGGTPHDNDTVQTEADKKGKKKAA